MQAMLVLSAFLLQAAPQDAMTVLRTMAERQGLREATVDNYTVIERYTGMEVPFYHEKTMIDGLPLFRVVPMAEWQARNPNAPNVPGRAMAAAMGPALKMTVGLVTPEMSRVPGGAAMGGYLNAFADSAALFLRAAATAPPDSSVAQASEERKGLEAFAARARLMGRDTVQEPRADTLPGPPIVRDAFLLQAAGLASVVPTQTSEAGTYTVERVRVWIDAAEYVQLRMTVDGRLEKDGKVTPITIELRNQHYAAAGPLLLPTRKVMRIEGLMDADPKQRREFEKAKAAADKARADMAKMKEQLAKMPAAQRRMIEDKMQSMLAQLDQMTADGTIEAVIEREVLGFNEGPPFDWVPTAVAR